MRIHSRKITPKIGVDLIHKNHLKKIVSQMFHGAIFNICNNLYFNTLKGVNSVVRDDEVVGSNPATPTK